jgi:hypothetical protein
MTQKDLELLDAWRHGRIAPEEFASLQERLREDAGLRRALRHLAEVEEGLSVLAFPGANTDQSGEAVVTERGGRVSRNGSSFSSASWWPWAIAAAACVAALLSWGRPGVGRIRGAGEPGATTAAGRAGDVTAMLVDQAGADFVPTRPQDQVRFDPGRYELKSGTVHLRFASGADLLFEGPASFEIQDALHARLISGRLRAIVPPSAQGFTVSTTAAAYEDVGTEFGLSQDARTGEGVLHVFDGQVNVRPPDATGPVLKSVYSGESIGARAGQFWEFGEADVGPFPAPRDIGHVRWASQRAARQEDAALIGWFPFEPAGDTSVLPNAVRGQGVPDGRVMGARWATGRWPLKHALWFDGETDFVELDIPGAFTELTVAAWIKVDRYEHEHSAILNSDGEEPGGFHFQLSRLGFPRGGVLGLKRTEPRWAGNPIPLGKWVHVTSVLSLPQKRHYIAVNGRPVMESQLNGPAAVAIQPGRCRLGQWWSPKKSPQGASRCLRGAMDELAIWNRALSESEVAALTESGRPSFVWARENPPLKLVMPKL